MNKQQLANKIWASANKMRSSVGKSYIYHKHDGKVYFAGFLIRMQTEYALSINNVDTYACLKQGSVLSEGNEIIIPASGETAEEIALPSLAEQKIASFFCFLDTRISLETQRLDKLKQIKSACLDKIFV